MAQCEERSRWNMSIFRDFSTKQWAILIKAPLPLNWGDVQMANISGRKPLARATSPRGASFGPICSPFGRLDAAVMEYGPWGLRTGSDSRLTFTSASHLVALTNM